MISTARLRSMIRVHRICSLLGIGASSSNGGRTEEELLFDPTRANDVR